MKGTVHQHQCGFTAIGSLNLFTGEHQNWEGCSIKIQTRPNKEKLVAKMLLLLCLMLDHQPGFPVKHKEVFETLWKFKGGFTFSFFLI